MLGVKLGGMVSGASQCRMLGSLNSCRLPMIEKTTATTIAGRSAGSLIDRAIRAGPAPSISAASYRSPGTDRSAA